MKLLFDQNLSFKLANAWPIYSRIPVMPALFGLERASDQALWQYAGLNGYALVSLDADFAEMAALRGAPPKVIWLRSGNQSTAATESLLRRHAKAIGALDSGPATCLEIY